MTTVAVYNCYFDSKYRDSGTNPEPQFNLETPITLSDPNHRFTASIKSCDIPFSFKSLVAPFNTLRVQYIQVPSLTTTFTITIPEGNYSISVLCQTLLSLVNTAIVGAGALNPPRLNFTYDKNTGKVTFTITQLTGTFNTTVRFYWSDPNVDILAEFFGFTGTVDTILNYNGAGVPTYTNNVSQIHVNCSPISSLYIRSSTLVQPTANEELLTEFKASVSDILLKVPVSAPFNTWLMYQNSDIEVMLTNRIIDVVSFYLTALTYDPISLDGVHWKVHLQIREIRDEWIDRMEEERRKSAQELQQLEMQRSQMMRQLEGLQGEMQQSRTSLMPIIEEKEPNIETLEKELLTEVEKNRERDLS